MLTYNNAHTVSFGGYPGLVRRWIVLHKDFFFGRGRRGMPMAVLTIVLTAMAVLRLVQATIKGAHVLTVWDAMLIDSCDDSEHSSP